MDMQKYYRNLWTHISSNERHAIEQGTAIHDIGFDRTECILIIKALKKFGYTHKENIDNIAVYEKETKDERFTYTSTIQIGKVFKDNDWFSFFKYSKKEERHTWLIGDTDYSNQYNPATLTRRGWWTGD